MSEGAQETALVPISPDATAIATTDTADGEGNQNKPYVSSIEKAAIVMTAIGPELASSFLQDLDENDMERFAKALGNLGKISQETLDRVIVEFLEQLTSGPELSGGDKAARSLLSGLVDDDEIERILNGRTGNTNISVWQRLNLAPTKALANFLQAEHPQSVAVILTEIRSDIAAQVLEFFDEEFAKSIIMRLSRTPSVDKAISARIEKAIERDFLSALQENLVKRRPAELIAGLMNNVSSEPRDAFLAHLEEKDPMLARDVQRTMFTFDDIYIRLQPRDVAGVLRDMEDDQILIALKFGQMKESPSVEHILSNLPRRLSERYADDIQEMGDVPAKEGEAAHIEMTKIIQDQAKRGTITLLEKDPDSD